MLMNKTRNQLIFLVPLFVALASFTLLLLAVVNGWMGPPQGVGRSFCEASDGWIKQPVNTWSNFGFIAAGLAIAWRMWKGAFSENHNAFTQTTFTPVFFSSLVVLLGPGSMAMHATLTRIGGVFDRLSMHLIAGFLVAYSMQRFFGWKPRHFTIVFVVVMAANEWAGAYAWAGAYRHHIPLLSGRSAFFFCIVVTTVFEALNSYVRKLQHEKTWLIYALVSVVIAFVFWSLWRTTSPLCDPRSLMQGHAVWHLLCALSLFFLFRFYVSEHRARGAEPVETPPLGC